MEQSAVLWIGVSLGALMAGAAVVGMLVAPRSLEPLAGLGGSIGTLISIAAFIRLPVAYGDRYDVLLYATAFVLAAFGGGYALASSMLELLVRRPKPLSAPSSLPDQSAGPACVLMHCVEPEVYDARITAAVFETLATEELLDPSLGTMPFLFLAQKARYRAVGGKSPSLGELRRAAEGLDERLEGIVVKVATCSGALSLDRVVSELASRGHRTVVVAELTASDSLHLSGAKRAVDASRIPDLGVSVSYTGPLWDAERISSMVTERVIAVSGDLDETGVVLVGHGQPEERARRNPAMDEQEAALLNRVRQSLLERGIADQHLRIAWAEWREPDVTSAARHLAALGCRHIVVSPACYPLDTIATRLELEMGVRQARVDPDVNIVTLPAWQDDDAVLDELSERVLAALKAPGE